MRSYSVKRGLAEKILEDFPETELKTDDSLFMYEDYVKKFELGEKKTTIRYKKNAIRYPAKTELPLIQSKPDSGEKKELGTVRIEKIVIKEIKELTEEDARNDGFKNKEELISVIEGIYGKVEEKELVSIYHIH